MRNSGGKKPQYILTLLSKKKNTNKPSDLNIFKHKYKMWCLQGISLPGWDPRRERFPLPRAAQPTRAWTHTPSPDFQSGMLPIHHTFFFPPLDTLRDHLTSIFLFYYRASKSHCERLQVSQSPVAQHKGCAELMVGFGVMQTQPECWPPVAPTQSLEFKA